MRTGHLQPTRPEWFDRTPVAAPQAASGLLQAPSGVAVSWSYTVPVGKKAWIASVFASIGIATEGSGMTYGYASVDVVISGVAYPLTRAWLSESHRGARSDVPNAVGWVVPAGTTIQGAEGLNMTGGQYQFVVSAAVTEFDA